MQCKSVFSDSYYYSLLMNTLQNCIDSRAVTQGRLVHNHIVTSGFGQNIHLNTKVVIFYSKVGRVLDARKMFDTMPERSVVSWTAMISGYARNGCYGNAFDVFVEMHRASVRANQFGYGSTLRACTGLSCLKSGIQIQGCVEKTRFAQNLYVQSALIDFHSKCGRIVDACYVFHKMPEKDLVAWNSIIGGYAVQGCSEDSFRVFSSMMREEKRPDSFTLGSLLRGLVGLDCLSNVSQVHGLVVRLGFESCIASSGSLINAYAKCGSVGSSHQVFESMSEKDIVSCTAMILGYAQSHDHYRHALALFKEMTRMNMSIDEFALCVMLNICANVPSLSFGRQIHALTFKHQARYDVAMGNALIDMYAKAGGIEEAERAFHEMEEKNVVSWTSLIAGYGKHGFGTKAVELYKKMEHEGLKPNTITFLSLLFACSHTGSTEQGWECFNSMVHKYNIAPREEHISCLVDILARGGRLDEAHRLIEKMNVKPNASAWRSILGACSVHGDAFLGEVAAKNLFLMDPDNPVNYVVLASIYSSVGAWDNAGKIMSLIRGKSLKKEQGFSIIHSTTDSSKIKIKG